MATRVVEMSQITLIKLEHTIWDTPEKSKVDFWARGCARMCQIWPVGTKWTEGGPKEPQMAKE